MSNGALNHWQLLLVISGDFQDLSNACQNVVLGAPPDWQAMATSLARISQEFADLADTPAYDFGVWLREVEMGLQPPETYTALALLTDFNIIAGTW